MSYIYEYIAELFRNQNTGKWLKKWLNTHEKVECMKILWCTNEAAVIDLGRYLN